MLLKPGEQTTVGRYTVRNDGVKVHDDGQKQMVDGVHHRVRRRQADRHAVSGEVVLPQARDRSRRPRSRSGGRSPRICTSCSAASERSATQSATLQIVVNPLVNWIWLGFGVLAFGTGIALLPERAYLVRAGEAAGGGRGDDRRRCCSCSLLLGGTTLSAQHGMARADVEHRRRRSTRATPFEKQLQHEIVCTCGSCGHTDDRRVPQGSVRRRRTRCAASWPRSSTGQDRTTRSSRPSSRSTAARKCSARRSTRASTAGVAVPVPGGRDGAVVVGFAAVRGRAHAGRAPDADRRRRSRARRAPRR